MKDVFDRIRASCAEVTRRARSVRIDEARLDAFAAKLAREAWPEDDLDPMHDEFASDAESGSIPDAEQRVNRLAFTIALDAINFGSGWFPVLRKRGTLSGYRSIATAVKEFHEREGGWSGALLRAATPEWVAGILGQDRAQPEVDELMSLYAQAWRELGTWLAERHGDRFESVVIRADRSAARLVESLAEMSLYQDVARYDELEVPFYKRAQITVADLHRAFSVSDAANARSGAPDFGRFDDLERLTLFADNLVPHVLRCHGVLVYDAALTARIEAGERIEVGRPEEVEIRAVAVEAVERLVAGLSARGRATTAQALDGLLWNAGQAPEIKARPRHRTRCTFY